MSMNITIALWYCCPVLVVCHILHRSLTSTIMRQTKQLIGTGLLLASTVQAHPKPHAKHHKLFIPRTAENASIPHANSFASFSFEPAFWVEFFGNASDPNALTFGLLDLIVEHGGNPIIRPGGITMDSMVSSRGLDHVVPILILPIRSSTRQPVTPSEPRVQQEVYIVPL
jgi:hypothetical protein